MTVLTFRYPNRLTHVGRIARSVISVMLCAVLAMVIAHYMFDPRWVRGLIAGALVLLLVGISVRRPATSLYLLVIYLPLMGFIRRWLIPVAGWSSFDPLVIVCPVVVLLLGSFWVYHRYIRRDSLLAETRLFILLRWLILVDVLEVVNPKQGGIFAGFGGFMFYVIPLFWMVLSKAHLTERWFRVILATALCIGTGTALYGLKQTFYGFTSFEQTWINLSGYAALIIGQSARAFSTFTNAAEYAQYLALALAIAWVCVLRGPLLLKLVGVASGAVMGYALFLESSRAPVITVASAMAVTAIVAAKPGLQRGVVFVTSVIAVIGLYAVLGHLASSHNALVQHQVQGLLHPTNTKDSTADMHVTMVLSGFLQGITHPFGSGLGATTLAADKMGNVLNASNSELDLSNMFISDGLVGGVLYLLIFVRVLVLALLAARDRSMVSLSILGILIATIGQWSNGGDYSTCAFVWLCIGYLDKRTEGMAASGQGLRSLLWHHGSRVRQIMKGGMRHADLADRG